MFTRGMRLHYRDIFLPRSWLVSVEIIRNYRFRSNGLNKGITGTLNSKYYILSIKYNKTVRIMFL